MTRIALLIAVLLSTTYALVEFEKSKLYDETDFTKTVNIQYCSQGCRVYVSVPAASAEIAKKIALHDFNNPDVSLYDISLLKDKEDAAAKGYFETIVGQAQIDLVNGNDGGATAPIAVWVVRNDADNIGGGVVYEAANLVLEPKSRDFVTVMSAAPFTLRSTTQGSIVMLSVLAGYDSVTGDNQCRQVIFADAPEKFMDYQLGLYTPLISFFYDDATYPDTKIGLTATLGIDESFDFSRTSFVTSPGYAGCAPTNTYQSSLYPASVSYKYSKPIRMYDVALSGVINVDVDHPVVIKDNFNDQVTKWSTSKDDITNEKELAITTNDLEISWTRNDADLSQSFFISLRPSNEQFRTTPTPTEGTTVAEEDGKTTTQESDDTKTTVTDSDDTKTTQESEDGKTTESSEDTKTTQEQDKTSRRTTTPTTMMTDHPKSTIYQSSTTRIAPTTTTTVKPTTSGSGYALPMAALTLVSAVFL